MSTENDPHLVSLITTLGEVYDPEDVARIAVMLTAEGGPTRALADAAADVLRLHDDGALDRSPVAVETLRKCLYGVPDGG